MIRNISQDRLQREAPCDPGTVAVQFGSKVKGKYADDRCKFICVSAFRGEAQNGVFSLLVIPPRVFTSTVHADGKINPIWIHKRERIRFSRLVLAAQTKTDFVQL